MLNKNYFIRYIYLSIFSIALAYLEAAAVIYIRQLLYPQGFQFPITSSLSSFILHIEILREFSTLIIIFSVALLAGKKFIDRFAYLIYIFAVWDIFYYVFLKLTIKWPLTFLTWDVLFLIPIPWTSPILFPLLCSVTMLAISIFLYYYFNKYNLHTLSKLEWSLLAVGAFIIFISFIFNYLKIIFENFNLILKGISLSLLVLNYIPQRFYWEIFTVGELITISSLFVISRRVKKIEVMKKD
ncbi:MAG: hypothetical protein NTV16_05845 [Actinobacteria bacterium]|nr:hypothetical protein [Actinomycetota bacterium]